MLVLFAAFRKEADGLLKIIESKKIMKINSTVIYDGTIKNKRIVICITGIGKSNSLFAVSQIIKMNLENPVFIIQGISGAVAGNLSIGDLVIYDSIKNLEKFQGAKNLQEDTEDNLYYYKHDIANDNEAKSPVALQGNEDILHLNYEEYLKDIEIKNLGLLKVSGGLVSYVVTDRAEKDILNKVHDVEAIDMESYYIADNAINNEIPVICIRTISDNCIESIPELIIRFKNGNFYCKIGCLAELIFSKTQSSSMLASAKNIAKACSNLNYFIKKIILPHFGYE